MTTATGRRKPYPGSRFSDPDWTNLPPATPPAGFPPLADDEPTEPGFHQEPAEDAQLDEPEPAPRRRPSFSPPDTGDASGFLLGLFGTILFLQYLHGGPAQVRKWLAAKFLNRDGDSYGPVDPFTGTAPDKGFAGTGLGALRPSQLTPPGATDNQGRPY